MTKDRHKQDHELVQACLAGDPDASEQLVREALDQVRRVLYRVLGPDTEYEDHVQEIMYQTIKSLPRFRGAASWRTWVTRITVNQARQFLRQRRRRPTSVSLDAAGEFPNPGPGPENNARNAELRRALYEVMGRLDQDKRLAVALYELAGLSMAEVADATGVTRSTAKSRVWFGRKYLLEAAARHPALAEWFDRSRETLEPAQSGGKSTRGNEERSPDSTVVQAEPPSSSRKGDR